MMIKVGDEFLEFDGEIIVEKQLLNYATLDTAGTFSYSFTVPPTTKNKNKLGIYDLSNNENVCLVDDVQILTDSGIPLYKGYILVDDPIGIECSFFSENNNFFTAIQGNVSDLDRLSQYDVFLSEANIVASWNADSGVVFPLCDRGGVWRRKDPFMKLRRRDERLDQNDWQPFIYVKDVMTEILTKANLKMSGDLINDGTYQKLITTNSSQEVSKRIIDKQSIYVGSETSQTIPNGSANEVKIQFELYEDLPFFNSALGNFDPVLNRWTSTYDVTFIATVTGIASDDTKYIVWNFRRTNGNSRGQRFTQSSNFQFTSNVGFASSDEPQYDTGAEGLELWAYVDPSTAGTVDITNITLRIELGRTYTIIAQSLIPTMTSREFISDIFKMFNVVADFDPYTRTIRTKFMQNALNGDYTDMSSYIHGVESLRNLELISDLSQENIIKYAPLEDSEPVLTYNENNELEYASGSIDINNIKLSGRDDLFELKFKAPFVYRHEGFGLYLVRLDFIDYADATADVGDLNGKQSITSVTDNGGLAQFNWSLSSFVARNNFFINDATGLAETIGGGLDGFNIGLNQSQYQENENDNQVVCIYLKNVSVPNSFNFSENTNTAFTQWPIIRISGMSINTYDGDWETALMDVELRTSAGVAIFSKALDGTELDIVKQGLSFGEIPGLNSLTLKDSFYRIFQSGLNNPIKPIVQMLIPENVFINLDFTSPIRIETEQVNGLFMINKCTGYINSKTPCTFELIKISV